MNTALCKLDLFTLSGKRMGKFLFGWVQHELFSITGPAPDSSSFYQSVCWMPKEFWVNSKQREEIYFFCKVSGTALEPTQPALQVLLEDVSPWLKVKNIYIPS